MLCRVRTAVRLQREQKWIFQEILSIRVQNCDSQGFGRMQLDNSLPLASSPNGMNLQVCTWDCDALLASRCCSVPENTAGAPVLGDGHSHDCHAGQRLSTQFRDSMLHRQMSKQPAGQSLSKTFACLF